MGLLDFLKQRKSLDKDKLFTLKTYLKAFFEGDNSIDRKAVIEIPIEQFQINDMEAFVFKDGTIEFVIYAVRPGLMIGKGGNVIRKLGGYLSSIMETKVMVCVKERNIWSK